MTLGSFIIRNAFRNKRRSLLTVFSISFSLLLLTLMICIWRSFYVDQVAPEASRRVITRDRVSLAFFLPAFYRDKIRSIQGVTAVTPISWFGGRYIDERPEHFAQFQSPRGFPGRAEHGIKQRNPSFQNPNHKIGAFG